MFYPEYAIAARTHFKSCKFLYDNCIVNGKIKDGGPKDILYRLYYLCGHVIECASIFLIYDFFKWHENDEITNWNGKVRHIHMGYNKKFTKISHMDFHPLYVDPGTKKILCKSPKYRSFDLGSAEPTELFYNVHSHFFQGYIKGIIWPQLPQDVPYLRPPCPEDSDYKEAIDLLESWSTDLRYYYEGRKSGTYVKQSGPLHYIPAITVENIGELLILCERIIKIIPSGKTL